METEKGHAHGALHRGSKTKNVSMIITRGSPGTIVFVGLCLFIVKKDRVTVAMLRDTHDVGSQSDGESCLAHTPFLYQHARDIVTLGIRDEVRSFPDPTGGEWIGFGLQAESEYGSPANGRPQYTALKTSPFSVPDLTRIGGRTEDRQLKTTWPNQAAAVIDLYGGVLTTHEPLVEDFRIEWVFSPLGASEPNYERMCIAEQVIWTSGNAGPTLIATNLPLASVSGGQESEKQLTHFAMFYDVFKEAWQDPVVVPSVPSQEIEVFPIFCPPAMFVEG